MEFIPHGLGRARRPAEHAPRRVTPSHAEDLRRQVRRGTVSTARAVPDQPFYGRPRQHQHVTPFPEQVPRLGGGLRPYPWAHPLVLAGLGVVGGYEIAHLAGGEGSGNLPRDVGTATGKTAGGLLGGALGGLFGLKPEQASALGSLLLLGGLVVVAATAVRSVRKAA